ncbi:MAG: hypothetical protein FWE04_01375 [Oscillospiraceae bacterium]|nr:hypothetical protein [Oscillospiraceae bacterium]
MKNNDLLSINPVENYDAPKIPTLDDNGNAEMLKKLPNRWKKKAAVIACAGIVGVSALSISGCAIFNNTNNRINDCDYWCHHGGAGMAMYIVHLTEQEALGIIRPQLEAAGLNFSAEPPSETVEVDRRNISLDLFDAERNVAVAHTNTWRDANLFIEGWECDCDDPDITIGVFQTEEIERWNRPSDDERAEDIAKLEGQLTEQVQEFIAYLRAAGILE